MIVTIAISLLVALYAAILVAMVTFLYLWRHYHIFVVERGRRSGDDVPKLRVVRVDPSAVLPRRATAGAAGYDLHVVEGVELAPGRNATLSTGLKIAVPPGHYGRIAIRSGFAKESGAMLNAGVLDEDYRGVVHVMVQNGMTRYLTIKAGDRIAQLIIEGNSTPEVEEVKELDETARGSGGFGSTDGQKSDALRKRR